MSDPRCYADADRMLHRKCDPALPEIDSRKIASNTYLHRRPGGAIAVRLHQTDIVTWTPDGRVHFNTGGWNTVTTRERMNRYAPEGTSFYTRKRVLFATFRTGYRWDPTAHGAYPRDCSADCRERYHLGAWVHDASTGEITFSDGISVSVGGVDVRHGHQIADPAPARRRYVFVARPMTYPGDSSGAVLIMPPAAPVWTRAS